MALQQNLAAQRCTGGTLGTALVLGVCGCLLLAAGSFAQAQGKPSHARLAATAFERGDVRRAVELYGAALKAEGLSKPHRAQLLNDRGVGLWHLGRHQQAIKDFNAAIILYPENASVYNNRGNLLFSLEHQGEAIKDFNRALLLAPGYVAALNNRANVFLRSGRHVAALNDFDRAIKLLPTGTAALNGRGRVQLAMLRPHAAMRDFSRAVRQDPRYGQGYRNRADALMALARYKEAIEDLSRAAAFTPTDPEIYVLRGTAYLYTANIDAALTDFSKAIELNPQSAGGFRGRGLAHAREEDFDDALSDLGRALAYGPQSDLTHAHRAVVYAQMGTPELGLKDVERGLKINAKSAHAFWARGEIELALGRREPAIASLRQALDQEPGHRGAKLALARLGEDYEPPGVELEGAGSGLWQVIQIGRRYVAVNASYRRVRVPLEMLGGEKPRILDFELKERPFNGIGVLRFYAGKTRVGSQLVDLEQAVIIDLSRGNVVAIEPYRLGSVLSRWQWGNGRVVVTSADGLTSQFQLRHARRLPVAARGAGYGQQKWLPPWAIERGDGYETRPPPKRRSRSRRRKKKSLFDMIFN